MNNPIQFQQPTSTEREIDRLRTGFDRDYLQLEAADLAGQIRVIWSEAQRVSEEIGVPAERIAYWMVQLRAGRLASFTD